MIGFSGQLSFASLTPRDYGKPAKILTIQRWAVRDPQKMFVTTYDVLDSHYPHSEAISEAQPGRSYMEYWRNIIRRLNDDVH